VNRTRGLFIVLLLNLALIAGLVIVGIHARSLGVLAAGADYLADAAAIGVSLLAIWLSRRPLTAVRPQGYPRATTIAAGVNGGWLGLLCVLVVAGAIARLVGGVPEVDGLPVLVVSAIAAAVMVGGVVILGGGADELDGEGGDLNLRAVLLDTAADAAAAAGVAVTGAVILLAHGWYWLDPAVALVIALVIGYHAVHLLRAVLTALRKPITG